MGLSQTIRSRTKLSLVYIVGDGLTNGIAFLLLPIYAHFLSPEDFGILAIITVVRAILTITFSFGLNSAVMRFYHQPERQANKKELLGAIWTYLILIPGVVAFLLDKIGEPIASQLLQQVNYDPYIKFTIWTVYLQTAFCLLPPAIYRAKDEAKRFVAYSFSTFFVTTILTILLISIIPLGSAGVVYARLLSSVVISIISVFILMKETRISFNLVLTLDPLVFSIPLVPHNLAHWILNLSDRMIMEKFVSIGEIGVYSIGYQFGVVYGIVVTSINGALMTMFSRASTNLDDQNNIPRIITYYILVITCLALLIMVMSGPIIGVFLPNEYQLANSYIPFVVLGYYALGIYYIPMNTISLTVGRTKFVPAITLLASASNIIMNLILIPKYGPIAAAYNTSISFSILAVGMLIYAKRIYPVNYEVIRISKIMGAGIIAYLSAKIFQQYSDLINFLIGMIIIVIFFFLISISRFLNNWELHKLKSAITKVPFLRSRMGN